MPMAMVERVFSEWSGNQPLEPDFLRAGDEPKISSKCFGEMDRRVSGSDFLKKAWCV